MAIRGRAGNGSHRHPLWDAVDRWLEEDEEIIVRPRDPYHRLELRDTSRDVQVTLADQTLAVSSAPIVI